MATPTDFGDVEQGLAIIERNARAQKEIIDDLLDMSSIISGKVRLDVQRVDLTAVLAAAVETVRPAADAKGIRLQPVIDPKACLINGDPNRLQQVFWNLLTNAVKFTPKGGRVQVVLERVHSHLEVSVADSGEGISPEFLPEVFDRFRQADASTTRRHGGLGLGLAIVKQLVELHGGGVHVGSAGLDQGTTFRVMLPLVAVQPAGADLPDGERLHPRPEGAPSVLPAEALQLTGVRGHRRRRRSRRARPDQASFGGPWSQRPDGRLGGGGDGTGASGTAGRAGQRHRHARTGWLRFDPPGAGAWTGIRRQGARRGVDRLRPGRGPDEGGARGLSDARVQTG